MNKKAISGIVATLLLLSVVVVSIFSFQNWFLSNESSKLVNAEELSNTQFSESKVQDILDGFLYFYHGNSENSTINQIFVDGVNCNISSPIQSGLNKLDVSSCTSSIQRGKHSVEIITTQDVFSKKIYFKTPSIDCSSLSGGTWIRVPGNSNFGTNDFCVMKYEASNVASNPSSIGGNSPWVNINKTNAILECSNLGSGYHLITLNERMTIAQNIEIQASNWNSSTINSGFIYYGHSDNSPANVIASSSNDSDGYVNTGDSSLSTCDGSTNGGSFEVDTQGSRGCYGQKRTLSLSNGEIIWDFSGNAWEWNLDYFNTTGSINASLGLGGGWVDWSSVVDPSYDLFRPLNLTLGRYSGGGRVYSDTNAAHDGSSIHGFILGGAYNRGTISGLYANNLDAGPSGSWGTTSFRCSYSL